jgi:NAD(P)-dependent dehydrogenase (short-subunit alcohol dehydrogenase family)
LLLNFFGEIDVTTLNLSETKGGVMLKSGGAFSYFLNLLPQLTCKTGTLHTENQAYQIRDLAYPFPKMPVFVITGANRGLGLEFVRQLSSDSTNTILAATRSLSRDLGALESLKSNGATLHILECDTGSQDSITDFSKQVTSVLGGPEKKIDFLLNNAGINATSKLTSLTLTPESLQNHINVNVMGPAKTVQVLESHLQEGSVVMNMTSGLGSLAYIRTKVTVDAAAYSISKAALNMLTVHQSSNLKGKGVVVVCVDVRN